jgi:hypothetical protein
MQHRFPHPHLTATLLALGLTMGTGARAQDGADRPEAGTPGVSLSGFGTVGVVHSSEAHADFTSSSLKSSGAGATRRWSVDADSRLGLQLDLALDKRWSAVLQVVSEQDLNNSYRPRVEWANVKYQATPELALRLGRMALPMFLAAEYRKVGYAYPWVRPPVEAYGALPFTSGDGVDANYRWNLGALRNGAQVFYGHADIPLVAPMRAYGRQVYGLANTSDWGALSVRASLIGTEATTELGSGLFDAMAAFGPAGAALGRRYAIDHKHISIASVGASYDPGRWFAMAEASRTRTHSLLGATRSMYASAGWRHGSLTPYVTWSRVRATGPTSDPGLPLAGLPPRLAAQGAVLNRALDTILATIPQQTSISAGLRWDLHTDMALKLQYDRVTPRGGSRGTLINETPGFRSGQTVHVASVALDFVY